MKLNQRGETRGQRGFALIVIVLLVGMMSVGTAAMLDLVGVDQILSERQASAQRALAVAEAGVNEIITSNLFGSVKPTEFAQPKESIPFPGDAGALLTSSVVPLAMDGRYTAEIMLLGVAEVEDSNQQLFARMIYNVSADAETGEGQASALVTQRLDSRVTKPQGWVPTITYQQ